MSRGPPEGSGIGKWPVFVLQCCQGASSQFALTPFPPTDWKGKLYLTLQRDDYVSLIFLVLGLHR